MKKINKGNPPPKFQHWKRHNPNLDYKSLPDCERREVRQSCLNEQQSFCAYCCDVIDVNTSHNEHIKPQSKYRQLSLDYNNIVASCNDKNHCGHKKDDNNIPLTPLMSECETELEFKDAIVFGNTERAKETIKILGLNENNLINKRRQNIDALLYTNYSTEGNISNLQEEDEEILKIIRSDLQSLHNNQEFAFFPILLNMLNRIII